MLQAFTSAILKPQLPALSSVMLGAGMAGEPFLLCRPTPAVSAERVKLEPGGTELRRDSCSLAVYCSCHCSSSWPGGSGWLLFPCPEPRLIALLEVPWHQRAAQRAVSQLCGGGPLPRFCFKCHAPHCPPCTEVVSHFLL